VDEPRVARLIADLDSEQFAVRRRASEGLRELGEVAGPALREALAGRPTPEARRRLERLVTDLSAPVTSPERLRALRAVEALEKSGASEARQLLAKLAGGTPEARLTREARAALERLSKRHSLNP
jgi:hypothetical protein